MRDPRIYAQAMDARVYQYRDNTGHEVDAIVDAAYMRPDGVAVMPVGALGP